MSDGEISRRLNNQSQISFCILNFNLWHFFASLRLGGKIHKIKFFLAAGITSHQILLLLLSFLVKYVIAKIIHPRCFSISLLYFFKRPFHKRLNQSEGKKRWKMIITWLSCCRCWHCRSLLSKYRSHAEWCDWDGNHKE